MKNFINLIYSVISKYPLPFIFFIVLILFILLFFVASHFPIITCRSLFNRHFHLFFWFLDQICKAIQAIEHYFLNVKKKKKVEQKKDPLFEIIEITIYMKIFPYHPKEGSVLDYRIELLLIRVFLYILELIICFARFSSVNHPSYPYNTLCLSIVYFYIAIFLFIIRDVDFKKIHLDYLCLKRDIKQIIVDFFKRVKSYLNNKFRR